MLLGRIESVVMTVHYDIKILDSGLGIIKIVDLSSSFCECPGPGDLLMFLVF